jgi:hypothetical protein
MHVIIKTDELMADRWLTIIVSGWILFLIGIGVVSSNHIAIAVVYISLLLQEV